MTEMKPGWERVRFGDVVRLVREVCKDPVAAGIERVIGLEHLEPGDLRVRSWGTVAEGTTFTSRVRPGQVLFGKRRAYQRKLAVADSDAVCSGDIYVFESADPDKLLPGLLPFICQTDAFFDYAIGTSAGSLSPRTSWTSLAEFELVLPPLEEQRAIAGVLTNWRSVAEALATSVSTGHTLRKALSSRLFDTRSPLRPIGAGVLTSAFGPRFPADGYASDGEANAWTVRTTDFTPDGTIALESVPGAKLDERVIVQHALQSNDFLLSRSGEYAGMVRVFSSQDGDLRRYIPAAFLIRYRLDARVLIPEYLAEYCESPVGSRAVRSLARGSAQPNISGTAFSSLEIPMPPVAEQRDICDQLHIVRTATGLVRERLVAAEAAFRAELRRLLRSTDPV